MLTHTYIPQYKHNTPACTHMYIPHNAYIHICISYTYSHVHTRCPPCLPVSPSLCSFYPHRVTLFTCDSQDFPFCVFVLPFLWSVRSAAVISMVKLNGWDGSRFSAVCPGLWGAHGIWADSSALHNGFNCLRGSQGSLQLCDHQCFPCSRSQFIIFPSEPPLVCESPSSSLLRRNSD